MAAKFGPKSPVASIVKFSSSRIGLCDSSLFRTSVLIALLSFRDLKVLKLEDHMQNCLFVHDALHNVSPKCFHDIFHYTNEVHSLHTRSISHDRLFVKPSSTVRYSSNSVTSRCVSNWKHISSTLNISLYAISRPKLKEVIRDHLLGFYN